MDGPRKINIGLTQHEPNEPKEYFNYLNDSSGPKVSHQEYEDIFKRTYRSSHFVKVLLHH